MKAQQVQASPPASTRLYTPMLNASGSAQRMCPLETSTLKLAIQAWAALSTNLRFHPSVSLYANPTCRTAPTPATSAPKLFKAMVLLLRERAVGSRPARAPPCGASDLSQGQLRQSAPCRPHCGGSCPRLESLFACVALGHTSVAQLTFEPFPVGGK